MDNPKQPGPTNLPAKQEPTVPAKTELPEPPAEAVLSDQQRRDIMRKMGLDKRAIKRLMTNLGTRSLVERQIAHGVMTVYYVNSLEQADRCIKWIGKALNNVNLADSVKLACIAQMGPLMVAQSRIGKEFLVAADVFKPSGGADDEPPKVPNVFIQNNVGGQPAALPPVAQPRARVTVPAASTGDDTRDA